MKVNTVEDQKSRQISNLVAKKIEDLGNNRCTYYLYWIYFLVIFQHFSDSAASVHGLGDL